MAFANKGIKNPGSDERVGREPALQECIFLLGPIVSVVKGAGNLYEWPTPPLGYRDPQTADGNAWPAVLYL